MRVIAELLEAGVPIAGRPPTLRVSVAATTVAVTLTELDDRVVLEAACPARVDLDAETAATLALAAPGDTALRVDPDAVTATRSLVQPAIGVVYDALHDLAKLAVSVARLAPELPAPPPAAPAPEPPPAAPPTPAAPPAPAAPPPPPPEPAPAAAAAPPAPPWHATHRVPAGGLACYERADASSLSTTRLDPHLEIVVLETTGAWAHVECSNGWTTWVDGRALVALGAR